jgi:hypothetical protein
MSPNARPGENPVDIIGGTYKWKPSECSILANDLTPKRAKTMMTTKKN